MYLKELQFPEKKNFMFKKVILDYALLSKIIQNQFSHFMLKAFFTEKKKQFEDIVIDCIVLRINFIMFIFPF